VKIVVIGGNGLVGSKLVTRLRRLDHEVISTCPEPREDSLAGRRVRRALGGAAVVIDVSGLPAFEHAAEMNSFTASTRDLLAYEAAAGVTHHIVFSVVGAEPTFEGGHLRAKRIRERWIRLSGIPYTIVHATQFLEPIKGVAATATEGNVVRLVPVLIEPMGADAIANALSEIALGAAANGVVEIAGRKSTKRPLPLVRRHHPKPTSSSGRADVLAVL
jgi:uncharacterized protein YbjT (DUF2867 family)